MPAIAAPTDEAWLRGDIELDRLRKIVGEEIERALMALSEEARNCDDVCSQLLQYQRGRLELGAADALRAHLATCATCGHEDAAERIMTELLERHLPQHPASLALKRRLAAGWPASAPAPLPWWRQWASPVAPALAAAMVLLVALPIVYYQRTTVREADGASRMVGEAINDYLRVLSSQHRGRSRAGESIR